MKPRMSVLWLFTLLVLAASCGSARQKTLLASMATLNAMTAGFQSYDAAHQERLVNEAASREQAVAAVTAWRVTRDQINQALVHAYELLVDTIKDDDKPANAVSRAVDAIRTKLKGVGAPIGGLP